LRFSRSRPGEQNAEVAAAVSTIQLP